MVGGSKSEGVARSLADDAQLGRECRLTMPQVQAPDLPSGAKRRITSRSSGHNLRPQTCGLMRRPYRSPAGLERTSVMLAYVFTK